MIHQRHPTILDLALLRDMVLYRYLRGQETTVCYKGYYQAIAFVLRNKQLLHIKSPASAIEFP